MLYQIRAEFPNDIRDFAVSSATLAEARTLAEKRLSVGSGGPMQFDWRGQVVFVNCSPAEESRAASSIRYPLGALFHPRSIKERQTTGV